MSEDIAISVAHVSKAYRIWNDPGARLKSPLVRTCGTLFPRGASLRNRCEAKASSYYRDFYALKDISFEVRKGESVGIIGRNGSGKSTLLQIIAGTLRPTTGSAHVRGRIAALLELGSGFNPDFTGRENVYLNAAVLGMKRAETEARFDDIASFADIGAFLDQPAKTYSSGMLIRLAFAVSVSIHPDVLIVDEALAVGDAAFQRKCYRRIEELKERGCSFLFVSHDINAITNLCSEALLLEQGGALFHGASAEAGNRYQQLIFGEATQSSLQEYGDGSAVFGEIWLEDEGGRPIADVRSGLPFYFCYEIIFRHDCDCPSFGLRVTNVQGVLLLSTNTRMLNRETGFFAAGAKVQVKWRVTLPLVPGYVFFSAGCSHYDRDQFICRKLDVLKVAVLGTFHHAGLLATIDAEGFGITKR